MHLAAKPELNRYVCWKNIKCFMMEYTPRRARAIYNLLDIYHVSFIYIFFKSEFCQQVFRIGDYRLMV